MRTANFDYCLSNPPYQSESEDTSDEQIYPHFIDFGHVVAKESVMITPARFLFNAGKTKKEWNKEKLSDPFFSVVDYEPDSKKIFSGADITGGVAITKYSRTRKSSPIMQFIPVAEVNSALSKVRAKGEESLASQIYPQTKFDLEKLYEDYPEYRDVVGSSGREARLTSNIFGLVDIFSPVRKNMDDYVIVGLVDKKRVRMFVPRKYIKNVSGLSKYKVFLPGSNGSPTLSNGAPTSVIGDPIVAKPGMGCTQTFITIGEVDTEYESVAISKYLKTRFARTMIGSLKVTQANKSSVWNNLPEQDWTEDSDIDWTKNIDEIDEQLYRKYGLSNKEVAFMERQVKQWKKES